MRLLPMIYKDMANVPVTCWPNTNFLPFRVLFWLQPSFQGWFLQGQGMFQHILLIIT